MSSDLCVMVSEQIIRFLEKIKENEIGIDETIEALKQTIQIIENNKEGGK